MVSLHAKDFTLYVDEFKSCQWKIGELAENKPAKIQTRKNTIKSSNSNDTQLEIAEY